jgi:excisionase family DNA binding protein
MGSDDTARERPIKAHEAAALLGMTKGTIYQYVSRGMIPYEKRGRTLWFLRSELLAWDRDRTVKHPVDG